MKNAARSCEVLATDFVFTKLMGPKLFEDLQSKFHRKAHFDEWLTENLWSSVLM
jgi:hypothetical protein